MTPYITKQGDMVDAIARARYGSEHGGMTEAILKANPGLAARGPVLPENLTLTLPEIAPPGPRRLATVDLWS